MKFCAPAGWLPDTVTLLAIETFHAEWRARKSRLTAALYRNSAGPYRNHGSAVTSFQNMAKKTSLTIIANDNIWVPMWVMGYPTAGLLVALTENYPFIAPDDETDVFIKVTDAIQMNANDLRLSRSIAEKKFRAINAALLDQLLADFNADIFQHQLPDEWVMAYYYYLKSDGQPTKLLNSIRSARPELFSGS